MQSLEETLRSALNRLLKESGRPEVALARAMQVSASQLHGFLHPKEGKPKRSFALDNIYLDRIAGFFRVSVATLFSPQTLDGPQPASDTPSELSQPVTSSKQDRVALRELGVMAELLERVDHRIVGLLANLDEEQQESVRLYTLELLRGQSAIRRKAENHA